MRRKIFGAALIAAMALAAGWNFNQSKNETQLSDLALANVEALARNEGSCCVGSNFQVTAISGGWHCENDKGNSCCPIC